jgi:hypothetical protein
MSISDGRGNRKPSTGPTFCNSLVHCPLTGSRESIHCSFKPACLDHYLLGAYEMAGAGFFFYFLV